MIEILVARASFAGGACGRPHRLVRQQCQGVFADKYLEELETLMTRANDVGTIRNCGRYLRIATSEANCYREWTFLR